MLPELALDPYATDPGASWAEETIAPERMDDGSVWVPSPNWTNTNLKGMWVPLGFSADHERGYPVFEL